MGRKRALSSSLLHPGVRVLKHTLQPPPQTPISEKERLKTILSVPLPVNSLLKGKHLGDLEKTELNLGKYPLPLLSFLNAQERNVTYSQERDFVKPRKAARRTTRAILQDPRPALAQHGLTRRAPHKAELYSRPVGFVSLYVN